MDDLIAQIIRHQREAEALFSVCVMSDPDRARHDYGYLSPNIFKDAALRDYWTRVLVGEEPTKAAIDAGMLHTLAGKMAEVPSTLEIGSYALVIQDDDYLIRITEAANSLINQVQQREVDAVMDTIREMANNLPAGAVAHPDAADTHLEFSSMVDEKESFVIMTGIRPLDQALGGLDLGMMSVLAARPSMGKSSLAYQIAEHVAATKKRVLYLALEQRKRQLWAKRVCGLTGIDYRKIKLMTLDDAERQRLKECSETLMEKYQGYLIIEDYPTQTLKTIWQAAAEIHPDLIICDHMGLITYDDENEVKALGKISMTTKIIAKQFNLHFMNVYQLSRKTEGREDKRPGMADLRGSGEIEQNADFVMFLYRDDYYSAPVPNRITSKTELNIEKNRDGVRHIRVNLQYHLHEQYFYPEAKL